MKRLLLLALLLAGCAPHDGTGVTDGGELRYFHDDLHGVGCWSRGQSLHCLPDSEYQSQIVELAPIMDGGSPMTPTQGERLLDYLSRFDAEAEAELDGALT